MGTSGGETPAERVARLQLRKRELELLLATKNDELYRLCVQEVRLTGVVPPEAPASPDGAKPRRRLAHRLSTPSLSRDDSISVCETFSLRSGRVQTGPPRRRPATETTIATHSRYVAVSSGSERSLYPDPMARRAVSQNDVESVPLIYQYASRLKAVHNHHLAHMAGLPAAPSAATVVRKKTERPRRGTLQRTQTYHATSRDDCNNYRQEGTPSPNLRPRGRPMPVSPLSPQSVSGHRPPPPPPAFDFRQNLGERSPSMPDQRVKEKEWYESSLDSPSETNRVRSIEPRSSPQRPPAPPSPFSHEDRFNANSELPPPPPSPPPAPSTSMQQPVRSPSDVPFESPKNCTVVESGKWIPYREVSKPFEMSDFYKYSTKFRQVNEGPQRQLTVPRADSVRRARQEPERYHSQERITHPHNL